MKHATQNDYFASLSRKITGAGVLFFNAANQILLVEPTYKSYWEIPGGVVDALESPKTAAKREVKEELGLDMDIGRLLCVDYRSMSDEFDAYMMIFHGGILSDEQIAQITVDGKEIKSYRFVDKDTAYTLVNHPKINRIDMCLQAIATGGTFYLEHGFL